MSMRRSLQGSTRSFPACRSPRWTEEGARPSWFSFFTSPTLIFNTVGYFAFLYITFLLLTWTPKYLQDQFHYNLSSLWYVGMIPWLGSCLTVVIGGRLSDKILAATGSLVVARSWFAAGSFLLAGLCFLVIPWAESAAGVIALMTVANALNTLPNAVYWTVVIDTSPRSRTGTNSGIMHLFAASASIIAPTLTGYLVSLYGYNSMFVAAGCVMAIGMLSMLMVRPGEFRRARPAAAVVRPIRRTPPPHRRANKGSRNTHSLRRRATARFPFRRKEDPMHQVVAQQTRVPQRRRTAAAFPITPFPSRPARRRVRH